ncbi:unnamed protein product [Larinioides sclopetarius]|uniref:Serpin domain-containing protein n=1 Tax=Larinioides sclopetarius TaxID=280406 RepID=A0AAV2BNI2_9ARAC
MKSINIFSALFALWLSVTSTGGISSREDIYRENLRKLTFANNELAFNLYQRLVSGSSENVFFSPLSISTVFGMLFYGTRGNTAELSTDVASPLKCFNVSLVLCSFGALGSLKNTTRKLEMGHFLEVRRIPMMYLTSRFPYASADNFQALELPYKGENVSMLILLPNERDGLQDFEDSLTPERLEEIQRRLYRTKVDVSIPKFKLRFEKELSPEIRALGANQIFSGAADFSRMTSRRNVEVSQVVHKAVLEVNEKGSEAAAVTGIIVAYMRASRRTPQFKVDHPFLFAILEKSSNMILFLGRVNNL